jgi:hypothetical protein
MTNAGEGGPGPGGEPERGDGDRPRRSAALRRLVVVCVAILMAASLLYMLSIPFGLVDRDNRLGAPEIVLAVILLGALAFFAQDTYALSDFSFGPGGVSAKFQRRIAALEYDVSALRVAIAGLVTKHEWDHLAKLDTGGQALATWRDDRRLEAELYRLDAIQFLEAVDKRGIDAIRQDHAGDPNPST